MKELSYKGYTIEAHPEQLAETGRWSISVVIYEHQGGRISDRQFAASDTFQTEEEAIEHCYNFGKQIIDGW